VPTCVEQGLDIPLYQQPRTIWLPGRVTPDQAAFYVELMRKVQSTPEWKDYIEKSSQTSTFLAGADFQKFIDDDIEGADRVLRRCGCGLERGQRHRLVHRRR
jgi:putative tricarboxylic transport membrane protein